MLADLDHPRKTPENLVTEEANDHLPRDYQDNRSLDPGYHVIDNGDPGFTRYSKKNLEEGRGACLE